MFLGWSSLAIGALLWLWRKNRRRKAQEKEANRRVRVSNADLVVTSQGIEIFLRLWNVANPRGAVLMVHSFSWHSGCFAEVARVLNQRRYAAVGFDWRGHGYSGGESSTRGDFKRLEHLVSDAERVLEFTKSKFQNCPVFLLGDGFGATIGLQLALRRERNLEGLILSGPFVFANLDRHPPSYISPALRGLERIIPELKISTNEPKFSAELDMGMTETPTLRSLVEAHKGLALLEKRLHLLKCPFFALHGAQDRRNSPQNSKRLFDAAKSSDKTLMIYPTMTSCVTAESSEDASQVMTDVVAWLDARTSRTSKRTTISTKDPSTQKRARRMHVKEKHVMNLMTRNGF